MAKTKKKPPTAWDIAKPLLEKDFLEGYARANMKPSEVRALCTEYQNVKAANFSNNWRAMKKRIADHKNRAREDASLYQHDIALYKLAKN
eukprot:15331064-Ditylum_brightwellii.AAC.1